MSRITACFQRLASQGEKALVAYVTAGDPTLDQSYGVVEAVLAGGADVLELGVPFSDPTADGPVIERAAVRSLKGGTTVEGVLGLVRRLRAAGHGQPVVLFGYYNPFLQYGLEKLAADAADAGADGFLVVDLPPEHSAAMHDAVKGQGLDLIYLLTPTSDQERIDAVKAVAGGFVYYVSRTGVTGSAAPEVAAVGAQVARIKAAIPLPVCVGFGISTPEQVAAIGADADGVVVGSALVAMAEGLPSGETNLAGIRARVDALKQPLRRLPAAK
ncbi:MAG: tryptophan synthase alpha chain [Cyanobacteria bacterium RYN_339]|nr:tryptophan synthase alpha chain [Cyanobacteria bacterium RYN_339]